MTRRAFSIALASLAAGSPMAHPEPAFAPKATRDGLLELRSYRTFSSADARRLAHRLATLFPRAGIRPSLQRIHGANLTYLIPFEDLTARDRAWTVITADPEWTGAQFRSYRFSFYNGS
jgi:hypothetical protein